MWRVFGCEVSQNRHTVTASLNIPTRCEGQLDLGIGAKYEHEHFGIGSALRNEASMPPPINIGIDDFCPLKRRRDGYPGMDSSERIPRTSGEVN
jgi:hypothetical protein